MRLASKVSWDRVGAMASAVCAVHCLLTGVALGLLSVLGLGFLGSSTAEYAFLATTFTIGVIAVVHGIRKHHSAIPSMFFVAGLFCWLLSHFVFGHGHERGASIPIGGTVFAVLGGLCLITFHVLNQRMAHRCGCSHCVEGS